MEVCRDRRKQNSVYHRLMLGYTCYNIFYSAGAFLSTWPVPADAQLESYRPYGASGTTQTCTAQGVFIQIGVASNLYVAALALYYVLVARYNWKKRKLVKLEIGCHVCVFVFAIGTSVAGLFLKLFNNAYTWCWIEHYPLGCENTTTEDVKCTRGLHAEYYVVFCGYVVWLSVWAIVIVCMTLLCQAARRQAIKMRQYASGSNLAEKNLREVLKLAISYVTVFLLFNVTFLVARTLEISKVSVPFVLAAVAVLTAPFTGFAFVLVYLRPRFEKYVRRTSGSWKWRKISKLFQLSGVSSDDHELGTHAQDR
jgi:NADH:ubiquinone oxidoreductase subunit 3 (subunit A)